MLVADAKNVLPLNESDVLWRLLLPSIGSLLALAAGLGWSLLLTRQRSLDARVARIEERIDRMTTQDFCRLQHSAASTHLDDVIRPLAAQIAKLANGALDELAARVSSVEAQVQTLRAVIDERHPRDVG